MIIVLGESVVQVVDAAAAQYDVGLLLTGIASFLLLAGPPIAAIVISVVG